MIMTMLAAIRSAAGNTTERARSPSTGRRGRICLMHGLSGGGAASLSREPAWPTPVQVPETGATYAPTPRPGSCARTAGLDRRTPPRAAPACNSPVPRPRSSRRASRWIHDGCSSSTRRATARTGSVGEDPVRAVRVQHLIGEVVAGQRGLLARLEVQISRRTGFGSSPPRPSSNPSGGRAESP